MVIIIDMDNVGNDDLAKIDSAILAFLDKNKQGVLNSHIAELENLLTKAYNCIEDMKNIDVDHKQQLYQWLASYYSIYGDMLLSVGRNFEFVCNMQDIIRWDPDNVHYRENLASYYLDEGMCLEASELLNDLSDESIRFEEDSTAQKILKWALDHPELAGLLSKRLIKCCVVQISKHARNSQKAVSIELFSNE